jgi:hypothetical protein
MLCLRDRGSGSDTPRENVTLSRGKRAAVSERLSGGFCFLRSDLRRFASHSPGEICTQSLIFRVGFVVCGNGRNTAVIGECLRVRIGIFRDRVLPNGEARTIYHSGHFGSLAWADFDYGLVGVVFRPQLPRSALQSPHEDSQRSAQTPQALRTGRDWPVMSANRKCDRGLVR